MVRCQRDPEQRKKGLLVPYLASSLGSITRKVLFDLSFCLLMSSNPFQPAHERQSILVSFNRHPHGCLSELLAQEIKAKCA